MPRTVSVSRFAVDIVDSSSGRTARRGRGSTKTRMASAPARRGETAPVTCTARRRVERDGLMNDAPTINTNERAYITHTIVRKLGAWLNQRSTVVAFAA